MMIVAPVGRAAASLARGHHGIASVHEIARVSLLACAELVERVAKGLTALMLL